MLSRHVPRWSQSFCVEHGREQKSLFTKHAATYNSSGDGTSNIKQLNEQEINLLKHPQHRKMFFTCIQATYLKTFLSHLLWANNKCIYTFTRWPSNNLLFFLSLSLHNLSSVLTQPGTKPVNWRPEKIHSDVFRCSEFNKAPHTFYAVFYNNNHQLRAQQI